MLFSMLLVIKLMNDRSKAYIAFTTTGCFELSHNDDKCFHFTIDSPTQQQIILLYIE